MIKALTEVYNVPVVWPPSGCSPNENSCPGLLGGRRDKNKWQPQFVQNEELRSVLASPPIKWPECRSGRGIRHKAGCGAQGLRKHIVMALRLSCLGRVSLLTGRPVGSCGILGRGQGPSSLPGSISGGVGAAMPALAGGALR